MDERTLREIYLTGFEIVVKEAAAQNHHVQPTIWSTAPTPTKMPICCRTSCAGIGALTGAVVTDWGGSNDHALGVKNGSTLEMPAPGGDAVRELLAAVKSGKITEADVDARLDELLDADVHDTHAAVQTPQPQALTPTPTTHWPAAPLPKASVLLKNEDNLLPLARRARRWPSLATLPRPRATRAQAPARSTPSR